MHRFEETRILPCSARAMFDVVMDIDAYPLFLPWVAGSRILTSQDHELTAELVADLAGMKQSFRTVDRFVENKMVEIRLLDGPFNFLESMWSFDPIDESSCRVSFSIAFEFHNRMLRMLASPVFASACRSMVHAFERRAIEVGRSR